MRLVLEKNGGDLKKHLILNIKNKMVLLDEFKKRYPKADLSQFQFVPDSYGGYIYWKKNNMITVISYDDLTGKTWTDDLPEDLKTKLNQDLGLKNSFPDSLSLTNKKYPIPAIAFEDTGIDITPLLTDLDIFVSPKQKFSAKMRNIFKEATITFRSAKQSRRWLSGPDFGYWTQQLNFAVWCATSGCGISLKEAEKYPPVVYGFVKFHVYFTVRRILYELGVPLPDDRVFNQTDNPFNKVVYQRLCNEFDLTNPDFRWKGGRNHGLGDIFLDYGSGYHGRGGGFQNVHVIRGYDIEANTWPDKLNIFSDEGGTYDNGKLVSFIRNDEHGGVQYSWFVPVKGEGLTKAGLGRLNRSIEAFVYCVLGAQVNVRSSIVGKSGSAVEAQQEFMTLFESSVIEENISKSVQRYQLAVQEAKLRLDLAVAPGLWLIPSNLIINTESVIGYNNKLLKATSDMSFGVNTFLNTEAKQVGIKHNMGSSKVKLPHASVKPEVKHAVPNTDVTAISTKPPSVTSQVSQHETNLLALTVVAGGLAWYLFR